jgi:hypothetical protein
VLIGLTGYARTGKDSTADFMVRDYDFVKMSFADPMREALVRLDPIITVGGHYASLATVVSRMGWDTLKSMSPDVRPLLQRLGTAVGRDMFGENFWIDLAMERAEAHEDVVFADVRFKNEADAIKAAGGILIRILRDGYGPANDHISEVQMDDYPVDFVIGNHRDLDLLSVKVNVLLSGLKAGVV